MSEQNTNDAVQNEAPAGTDAQAAAATDERAQRLARRQAIIDAGATPYPEHSNVTVHADELLERYESLAEGDDPEGLVHTVAGRVRAKRGQGKVAFIVLQDPTATMQLFCRIDNMGEEGMKSLRGLDLGDIVEATGTMMRTRRGELSLAPTSVRLLSKSVRPLPEKFHGLSDKETRYRQRYVDLIVNDDVRETFRKRSAIVSEFRRYMEDNAYMEVETPILQTIQGGATAKPFITHFNALDQECFLRIATELPLKRLLVGGYEAVFEVGRIFRNEGMDQTHNPEFTTMEAYRAYSDLEGMKQLAEGVIKAANARVNTSEQIEYQGTTIDLSGTWPSIPMTRVVSNALSEEVDPDTSLDHLRELCAAHQIEVKPEWGAGKLIAELYDEIGEPSLVNPTFVVDYPVEVSPLAKRFEDDPRLTHRFELVIAGHEYANAFSELNDPVDQAERFHAEIAERDAGDDEAMQFDADYVRALEYGMPPAGGIGIGIDRVVMLLTNQASIRDVLLFPHMKPERGQVSGAAEAKAAEARAAEAKAAEAAAGAGAVGAAGAAADAVTGSAASGVVAPKLPTLDYAQVHVEPQLADLVDFDTFCKSDFRVVKVKACAAVPKSKKLLQFTLDDGTGADRTILSGIHAYYEPEDLVGKTLVAIVNLPPRKMMGIASCGMIISAVHREGEGEEAVERLNLLQLDGSIPAGAKLC